MYGGGKKEIKFIIVYECFTLAEHYCKPKPTGSRKMCLDAFSNTESTCTQSDTSYSGQNKAHMIRYSLLFAVNTFQLGKGKEEQTREIP